MLLALLASVVRAQCPPAAVATLFEPPVLLGAGTRASPADLDGDGDLDVLAAGTFAPDEVVWFENLGAGFAAARVLAASAEVTGCATTPTCARRRRTPRRATRTVTGWATRATAAPDATRAATWTVTAGAPTSTCARCARTRARPTLT